MSYDELYNGSYENIYGQDNIGPTQGTLFSQTVPTHSNLEGFNALPTNDFGDVNDFDEGTFNISSYCIDNYMFYDLKQSQQDLLDTGEL